MVVMLTWRISRARSSSAEMIFTAWPGMRGETVFRITLEPENFTSTSAIADVEFAASSLALSMAEVEDEEAACSEMAVAAPGKR